MPKPPEGRTVDYPWPRYPLILKTSSSHEEGGERKWSIMTKSFEGAGANLSSLKCIQVDSRLKEIPGSDFEIEADLVLLALGFLGPEKEGLISEFNLELDARGNIKTGDDYMTSKGKIFAAGDARRGQSLIVWAISEGRRAAYNIDKYLMGETNLPVFISL